MDGVFDRQREDRFVKSWRSPWLQEPNVGVGFVANIGQHRDGDSQRGCQAEHDSQGNFDAVGQWRHGSESTSVPSTADVTSFSRIPASAKIRLRMAFASEVGDRNN